MFPEGIFVTLWHCYLLRRPWVPRNLVILPGTASRKRFAIKYVKYAAKQIWRYEVNN